MGRNCTFRLKSTIVDGLCILDYNTEDMVVLVRIYGHNHRYMLGSVYDSIPRLGVRIICEAGEIKAIVY